MKKSVLGRPWKVGMEPEAVVAGSEGVGGVGTKRLRESWKLEGGQPRTRWPGVAPRSCLLLKIQMFLMRRMTLMYQKFLLSNVMMKPPERTIVVKMRPTSSCFEPATMDCFV